MSVEILVGYNTYSTELLSAHTDKSLQEAPTRSTRT